ncbi:AAA family ATPase [Calidifontibacter sp. DB0510]|uniref:AAA family ATPase n=1 Tax=Metallococcus carri TaxID=1656884 RepID=A0A967B4T5_9MICO|nr:AAA family ATPase [Metallococcus carri]NHN55632.1 AAA family ATPase [Metallococcus carri]NOP38184.1 ATP-binding protein [Calidifontibacter sp. DB2511S]
MSSDPRPPSSDQPPQEVTDPVTAAVRGWQSVLQERTGPNTMLWYAGRGRALDLDLAHPAGLARLFSTGRARLSDLARNEATYGPAAQRAADLARRAATDRERLGVDNLFLVFGTARWNFRGGATRAAAPVLLRRAALVSPGWHSDDLELRLDPQVFLNPVLVASLTESGVYLPVEDIEARAGLGRSGDVRGALGLVAQACAGVPGFELDTRQFLEVLTHHKLALVTDLAAQPALTAHPVLAAFAGDPAATELVQTPPPPFDEPSLDDEVVALDLDRDQQQVVEAVRAGAHLVLDGAPGTGKTQTVVGVAAALAADGRRTLVVPGSASAAREIARRLRAAGLDDLAVDARAGRVDPRRLLADLVDEVDAATTEGGAAEVTAAPNGLASARSDLAAHHASLHAPTAFGVTLDEAQSQVTRLASRRPAPRSRVRLTGAELAGMSPARRDQLIDQIERVARDGAWTTGERADPWYGAAVVGEQQRTRVADLVSRLAEGGLSAYRRESAALLDEVGLPPATSLREEGDRLELLERVRATLEVFRPDVFGTTLPDMVTATAGRSERKEQRLGVFERRRLVGEAHALLRPGPRPSDVHGVLVRAAAQREQWREIAGKGARPATAAGLGAARERHDRLRDDLDWLGGILQDTADGGDLLDLDFDDLQERLDQLAATSDRLAVLPRVASGLEQVRAAGLGPLVDDLARRRVRPEEVRGEAEFVWWTSVLAEVERTDKGYGGHDGAQLRDTADAYRRLDAEQMRRGAARVRESVRRHVRQIAGDLPDQVAALRAHATSPRPDLHAAITDAPELVLALRPIWLMGPAAVPMLIPPGMWFDLTVIDDASVQSAAFAVPAISRAGQVLVVGDRHQVAPAGGAARSILEEAARTLPRHTLTTHYRSYDERLVGFASARLYDGTVRSLPGPQREPAIRVDVVPGAEVAERVARMVLDEVERGFAPAVICLEPECCAPVEAALRALGRPLPKVEVRAVDDAAGLQRDVVIVCAGAPDGSLGSLARDGGDRRLHTATSRARKRSIVVSPWSVDDLDPTRARARGAIFLRDYLRYAGAGAAGHASAGGVDAGAAGSAGARGLAGTQGFAGARGLAGGGSAEARSSAPGGPRRPGRRRRTASTGSVLDEPLLPTTTDELPVPPLVAELAERLRHDGIGTRTNVGLSRTRIDLVLDDPHRPGEAKVAVITDSRPLSEATRDRERLTIDRLEGMGWQVERVWSRDLFRDPAREVARLQHAAYTKDVDGRG